MPKTTWGSASGVHPWMTLLSEVSKATGVPINVLAGVMHTESGGNQYARGAPTKWGQAYGLMQVMPFHFKRGENPLDPRTNVLKGASILANNCRRFGGDWMKAFQAYFAGHPGTSGGVKYANSVLNHMRAAGFDNRLPGLGAAYTGGTGGAPQAPRMTMPAFAGRVASMFGSPELPRVITPNVLPALPEYGAESLARGYGNPYLRYLLGDANGE